MNNFMMPPTGFGPGSQASGEEEVLDYTPLPSGMRTYAPHLPDIDALEDARLAAPALDMMAEISAACAMQATQGGSTMFDLKPLGKEARKLMAETMGEGEVALKIRGVPALKVQESVFAGVWVHQGEGVDAIEVAPVPQAAIRRAFTPHRPHMGTKAAPPADLANAPAILSELEDKSANFKPGQIPHVVNLTLLPHSPGDLVWLDAALGEGAVTMLSRGYGNCRVTATALAHVWRVQFFNSMDTLILDTFEVTDMPEVALAAPEDLTDSADRITKVIEAIA